MTEAERKDSGTFPLLRRAALELLAELAATPGKEAAEIRDSLHCIVQNFDAWKVARPSQAERDANFDALIRATKRARALLP